jgi:predicted nucleic acid-binding protein
MSNLVCIDSHIFIWGVKSQSHPSQINKIPLAQNLIKFLTENNYKILLPVPIIAEILSPVPPNEHPNILRLIDKNYQVAPFDILAAYKCAELINISLTAQELKDYKEAHSVPRSKIKFDCMIAAIAITRKAHCIYSEDNGLKNFASGQISVVPLPNLGSQTKITF